MWFFRSPEIIFGEDALEHLTSIEGQKALIITDENITASGTDYAGSLKFSTMISFS